MFNYTKPTTGINDFHAAVLWLSHYRAPLHTVAPVNRWLKKISSKKAKKKQKQQQQQSPNVKDQETSYFILLRPIRPIIKQRGIKVIYPAQSRV